MSLRRAVLQYLRSKKKTNEPEPKVISELSLPPDEDGKDVDIPHFTLDDENGVENSITEGTSSVDFIESADSSPITSTPTPTLPCSESKDELPERGNWGNQIEFFLTCLGYTVGLGNVWRFPYLCYENGGGAFLIPYLIMLVFSGLPLYGLELCIGQYASLGPNKAFKKMAPLFQGLGYAVLLVAFYTAIYYNVIIAWTIFYLAASFQKEVPWKFCSEDFNTPGCFSSYEERNCRKMNESYTYWNNTCLPVSTVCSSNLNTCLRLGDSKSECHRSFQRPWNLTHCLNMSAYDHGDGDPFLYVHLKNAYDRISSSEEYFSNYMLDKTDGWDDFGGLKWDLVLCSVLAWLLVAVVLIKGVQSSGKVVYFTALFPYAVLLIFCVKGATLPGAFEGFLFFITPKWELLRNPKVWVAAATQNFYSLGPAFGGLITFSSYNKFNHNCLRDSLLLGFADFATSFFAGSVVFAIVGYMAFELGSPISEVIKTGSGLAFIAYPDAISEMPLAPFWGILFFSMLMICGFDSEFTMVETMITALLDEKPRLRKYKGWVSLIVSIIGCVLGLSMVTRGGIYMFTLFDDYSAGWAVLLLGVLEAVFVVYVFGWEKFLGNVREMMEKILPCELYWKLTLGFITPVLVTGMVVYTWIQNQSGGYPGVPFPVWANTMGWLMGISPLVVVVGMGVYQVMKAKRQKRNLRDLLKPSVDWCPAHVREERKRTVSAILTRGKESGVWEFGPHPHRKFVHTDTQATLA